MEICEESRLTDSLLRRKGFRLYSRPIDGEPLWRFRFSDGTFSAPMLQSVAIASLTQQEANYAEVAKEQRKLRARK